LVMGFELPIMLQIVTVGLLGLCKCRLKRQQLNDGL